ncbi:MAG: N-acetyl-gamma-glutamyl-phosphate reductase [Endomicrobium sp.]|jgi:N-acetyl-gamma-glutamyl-phosphate reductase|nr:N-acetyl-gamma-glutamyl-phosphate reductase [Endomicrobium sp.]
MIKVGIVGITGYTGEELLKILSLHPDVKIMGVYGRTTSEQRFLKDVYPEFENLNLTIEPLNIDLVSEKCDLGFLALPHGASFEFSPKFINEGVKVIDLSADFRLKDVDIYEEWYKVKHTAKDFISKAVYGLSELNFEDIKTASLIANPGCYPTSIALGIAPSIKGGFVDLKGIVIDSKSGVSGAGRKVAQEYFKNEHPNFKAYKIAGFHRHIPEIEQELSILSKENVTLSFTPHIIPIERGMLSTIYVNLKNSVTSSEEVLNYYREFYKDKIFVKIFKNEELPTIRDVVNTNYCCIGLKVDKRTNKLIIISAIDNLVKGASGQAIQNMNIMFGLKETTGLI